MSSDTQPTRPQAESAKIRRYSARLSTIIVLLFNKLITKQLVTFLNLSFDIFSLHIFFPHTKLRISPDICYLRMTDIESIMTIFGQCYNLLNNKSRYFAATEFNNCFIIRSPSLFSYFNHYLATQGSDQPFFLSRTWFLLRMSRLLFAAKHVQTVLRMSRPLLVGSYLQVTWWAVGQWKGGKNCIE